MTVERRALDPGRHEFGTYYDELPLWSAPFGMLLLERVPLRTGITILDVGAGTGFLSIELAQRCGPSSRIIAVDPWTVGVERLREKLDHLGIDNVDIVESDAADVDLPAESVDLIVSNLGINNFDDPDAVLDRCHRVAKPDATLVLTTNLEGHMQEIYDVFRETLVDLELSGSLPGFDSHVRHRGTVETTNQRLEQAGFEVTAVTRDSFETRFADGTCLLRHHFIRLGFLPAWKELVPPDSLDRTLTHLEDRLNDIAARDGALNLTVPVACFEARKRARA